MRALTQRGLEAKNVSEVGVTRGLVAWYPLMGDTLDYAGVNHAVNNGAVATAEGYKFDGVDDTVAVGDGSTLNNAGGSLSFVFSLSDTATNQYLFGNGHDYLNMIEARFNASTMFFFCETLTNQNGFHSPSFSLPTAGEKVTAAVVFENSKAYWYINGGYIGEAADYMSYTELVDDFLLSLVGVGGYSGPFSGTLRDVRIHNVALTSEEVAIQAKLALNPETKSAITSNCLYTKGEIKEVIA